MPLADLFYSDLSALGKGNREAIVVGASRVRDWTCDHLAFRGENIDHQLWIEQGKKPVLRKLLITYLGVPGAPQLGAVFEDWDFSPRTSDKMFEFSAPEGAEQIATMARPRESDREESR